MSDKESFENPGRLFHDQKTASAEGEYMVQKYNVTLVAADGLGFGDGTIGVVDRISNESDPLNQEVLQKVDDAINSDEILVDVDSDSSGQMIDDDGCGDGRGVLSIFEGVSKRFKSLNRAKVFGASPVMMSAALIGLNKAKGSFNEVFAQATGLLKSKNIGYGGHSDTHAHGENCGCGAIDKAPAIIAAAIEKQSVITNTLESLSIDTTGINTIFANYKTYSDTSDNSAYSGAKALKGVLEEGKVVKELEGGHAEVRIVLNMVKGKTVNQELIREISDGSAQVFAVDVWRLKDIAERSFDTPEEQQQAFLSMLVHTLAVSAVLTGGDLPVYTISEAAGEHQQAA